MLFHLFSEIGAVAQKLERYINNPVSKQKMHLFLPSLPSSKCITLVHLKLDINNAYINANDQTEYFGLPREKILTIGVKIIMQADTEDEGNALLRAIKLSVIRYQPRQWNTWTLPLKKYYKLPPDSQHHHIHQILSITIIDIWEAHKECSKLVTAALNLKTKRKLLEILNATASIATAITKAKETINKTQTQNLDSTLSLINLEKSIRKQEQKTNQMIKSLHSQNTDQQKIST